MTLPKFEDWKAPWEVDLKEGDEPTFDFEKGKRYLYNVLSDKEKLQEKVTSTEAAKADIQKKLDEKLREGESEADRIKRERDELQKKLEDASKTDVEKLKLQVALDKGLTAFQAKRLVGETKEDLEADAEEILQNMGPAKKEKEEEEEGPDETGQIRLTPESRFRSPGDPKAGQEAFDVDKFADAYVAGRTSLG